jgi:hypothetical protein
MDAGKLYLSDVVIKTYADRLKSYDNWPSFLDPKQMVEVGFYYTRYENIVRSSFCKMIFRVLKIGDNPFRKHREQNRDCDFFRESFSTVPDTLYRACVFISINIIY